MSEDRGDEAMRVLPVSPRFLDVVAVMSAARLLGTTARPLPRGRAHEDLAGAARADRAEAQVTLPS